MIKPWLKSISERQYQLSYCCSRVVSSTRKNLKLCLVAVWLIWVQFLAMWSPHQNLFITSLHKTWRGENISGYDIILYLAMLKKWAKVSGQPSSVDFSSSSYLMLSQCWQYASAHPFPATSLSISRDAHRAAFNLKAASCSDQQVYSYENLARFLV